MNSVGAFLANGVMETALGEEDDDDATTMLFVVVLVLAIAPLTGRVA